MSEEQFTCPSCEEIVTQEDRYYDDAQWSDILDAQVCYGCYESDMEHRSTLVAVTPDGTHKAFIGDLFIMTEHDYGAPRWVDDLLPADFKGRRYVNTDAWRGYYDMASQLQGLVKLADGWTTGWVDDTTTRKHDFNNLMKRLDTGELVPPATIYVLIEPTSNIFSVSAELLVKQSDLDTITAWLDDIGTPADTLRYALS